MSPQPLIQVDMFEVQLGASILLQFRSGGGQIIRVLADGGQGPPVSDIRQKLDNALSTWGDGPRRIDLLIGTHYDADHLDGLLPIVNDESIAIREAWLPPVANDVERHSADDPLDPHFLAYQFYGPEGHRILAAYLDAKEQVCTLLRPAEGERLLEIQTIQSAGEEELDRLRARFENYRQYAVAELNPDGGGPYSHADEPLSEPSSLEDLWRMADPAFPQFPSLDTRDAGYRDLQAFTLALRRVRPGSTQAANLAAIRKSAANDAIQAISLSRIVTALRSREIPMRCHVINEGLPRRFVWGAQAEKFYEAGLGAAEPAITLLGPSDSLVRKHWNRLPIGEYATLALLARHEFKRITPSNQLSYVAHLAAQQQGILVTGDAGFVDFMPPRKANYYSDLLNALAPLDVVQVAHHGGNAAHFYRVLRAAGYPSRRSFLLLSHATHDKHRPADEFRQLAEDSRETAEPVNILFTAMPLPEKIRGLEDLVHPRVGPPADYGDIRLEYAAAGWQVTGHAVELTDSARDLSEEYRKGTTQVFKASNKWHFR